MPLIENMTIEEIQAYLDQLIVPNEITLTESENDLIEIRNQLDYIKDVQRDSVRVGSPISIVIHKSETLDKKVVEVYSYNRLRLNNQTMGYFCIGVDYHTLTYSAVVEYGIIVVGDVLIEGGQE